MSLNLSNKTVPKRTTRNKKITRHIALNGGVFLRRYTTKIPPQNKTFTMISLGVMVGGYDSRKKFIIKFKKKTSPPPPGAPKKQKKIHQKKSIYFVEKKRMWLGEEKGTLPNTTISIHQRYYTYYEQKRTKPYIAVEFRFDTSYLFSTPT